MEYSKKIRNLENAIARQVQESKSKILGKDRVIVELERETSLVIEESQWEIDDAKEMYETSLDKYTTTIENLEKELKIIPQVLKIPPLNIASNPEVDVLKNSLKEKDRLIQMYKFEFKNMVKQLHHKHNLEIGEYKNKLDSLKK